MLSQEGEAQGTGLRRRKGLWTRSFLLEKEESQWWVDLLLSPLLDQVEEELWEDLAFG